MKDDILKVVVVNAYGRTNRGDSILLDECMSEIKACCPDNIIRLSVVLYDNRGFSDIHPNVEPLERIGNVNTRVKGKLEKTRIWFVGLIYCLVPLRGILKFLPNSQVKTAQEILSSDLVVSAPGGYVHDTNLAYHVALFHLLIAVRGKGRVVLAPQSYGPMRSRLGRFLVKYVFNKADIICARESYSLDFLREVGVDSTLIVASGDSAFWNDNVSSGFSTQFFRDLGLKEKEEFVGMTVVDWNFPAEISPQITKRQYIQAIRYLICELYERRGLRTVFFNQVQDDLVIIPDIVLGLEKMVLVDYTDREPEILRELISYSKVFVGTRFHSCIFALMAGVPTNAIAYLPKTEYILRDLGFVDRHMNINKIDQENLLRRVLSDLDDISNASNTIQAAVTKYRNEMTRLSDVL